MEEKEMDWLRTALNGNATGIHLPGVEARFALNMLTLNISWDKYPISALSDVMGLSRDDTYRVLRVVKTIQMQHC